jgi:hypothetical protein
MSHWHACLVPMQGHLLPVANLALHPSKPILATASDDKTWKLWHLPAGDLIMCGEGHRCVVTVGGSSRRARASKVSAIVCLQHYRAVGISRQAGQGDPQRCCAAAPGTGLLVWTSTLWAQVWHQAQVGNQPLACRMLLIAEQAAWLNLPLHERQCSLSLTAKGVVMTTHGHLLTAQRPCGDLRR